MTISALVVTRLLVVFALNGAIKFLATIIIQSFALRPNTYRLQMGFTLRYLLVSLDLAAIMAP